MPRIGILSRRGPVIRAAVFHDNNLLHIDADTLHRCPLYTQTCQGVIRQKELHHYWVECPFGTGLLPQEKNLPALTAGQAALVQVSREAFFDTAENSFKAPLLTRKIKPEIPVWHQLIPQLSRLGTVFVDDAELMITVRQYCKVTCPEVNLKLVNPDLFAEYGIDETWDTLEYPTVQFTGGNIHIELTAAATVIDINGTGKAEQINMASLATLAQQLLWRNLSGSILIEFINHGQKHRPQLIDLLIHHLAPADPGFIIHGFSKLGFLEISREKRRAPLHDRKVFDL